MIFVFSGTGNSYAAAKRISEAIGSGMIDIAAAVLVVQVLMNLKVIPALWVLKRGKWVRNITVEGSQV